MAAQVTVNHPSNNIVGSSPTLPIRKRRAEMDKQKIMCGALAVVVAMVVYINWPAATAAEEEYDEELVVVRRTSEEEKDIETVKKRTQDGEEIDDDLTSRRRRTEDPNTPIRRKSKVTAREEIVPAV